MKLSIRLWRSDSFPFTINPFPLVLYSGNDFVSLIDKIRTLVLILAEHPFYVKRPQIPARLGSSTRHGSILAGTPRAFG
jgi:hypothetical protein